MNIELKSTGFLIDEWITSDLKVKHIGTEETLSRHLLLDNVVRKRLNNKDLIEYNEAVKNGLVNLVVQLRDTLTKCWDAQDRVMIGAETIRILQEKSYQYQADSLDEYRDVAMSAIEAQNLNAQRNRLIRQIDKLLGESEFTQLEKSYG